MLTGVSLRHSVLTQTVESALNGRNVLISGPSGSGRSHFLNVVQDQLRRRDRDPVIVDCADRQEARVVSQASSDRVLLFDRLEYASSLLTEQITNRIHAGGVCIATLNTSHRQGQLMRALRESSSDFLQFQKQLQTFESLELTPFSPAQMAHFVHSVAQRELDSATVSAIVQLAEGRPSWAFDLLKLNEHGFLLHVPKPSISDAFTDPREYPAMQSLNRALGKVTAVAAASANILTELESFDIAGAEDLVGSEPTQLLLKSGALHQSDSPGLLHVPPFLAAALHAQADTDQLDRYRNLLQERLLNKASIGIPLTASESFFCTRPLDASPDNPALHEMRRIITHQVIDDLLQVGDSSQARKLLLRADGHEMPADDLYRAKVLGVLAGPETGLAQLHHSDEHAHVDAPRRQHRALARRFLEHLFTQRAGLDSRLPEPQSENQTEDFRDIDIVLSSWSEEQSPADTARLIAISEQSDLPVTSLLASALLDLESVWQGQLPQRSWLTEGASLPHSDVHRLPELKEISATIVLSYALTVLLSGEYALRHDELKSVVEKSPLRETHERWLEYFYSASVAIACGDLGRAHREWGFLVQNAPRFIPLRLQLYLRQILSSLEAIAERGTGELLPADDSQRVVWQMIRYLAGKHMSLAQQIKAAPLGSRALPVLRLGVAHISAVESENPVELLRIGERLRQLELWAPAAFALTRARDIFLTRRAARGVKHSNRLLADLERYLHTHVPWYREGNLPTSDYVKLTPRERATAQLASKGLSNREIAEHLHCSVRTVESHLAQARAKLGAATRKDLVGLLARRTRQSEIPTERK